ncbi:hypothetical protein LTR36_002735 [Oleoguttula mirabilis]|uniref:Uncharacterized protein n=1 Tax=Oleoguttula mirabilis TaxID=1507867 RepID=A0AAV9JKL1_9PEZI|nr:hypothetical protein LTR36_002735 [Oleoguttula mirabilis]
MASYSAQSGGADQPGQLARSRPQLEFDVRQHQRRRIYGRPLQKLSSAASHYVAYQPYDVVFTSLRLVVFQIEPTSATPIAHIIRDALTDGDVFELIKGLDLHVPAAASKQGGAHGTTETSVLKDQLTRYGLLCDKIKEARVKHAERLRDDGMVDVDVIYKCSKYQVEPFKTDKEIMEAKGGRPYHMYPFREREQEMALSVMVKPEVLAMVYHPERCAELNIIIKTNTPQAVFLTTAVELPEESGSDTIFPRWEPGPVKDSPEKAMARTMSQLWNRGRSDSIKRVVEAPPVFMWRPFPTTLDNSTTKATKEKRNWTATNAPFLNHPGVEENEWCRRDLEENGRNLDEWNRETWKMCEHTGGFHRRMSSKDPSVSIPGDDFPVKQPMCETFTDDRDMNWWMVQRADAERQEYDADFEAYMNILASAERLYMGLAQLLEEVRRTPQSREARIMFDNAKNNRALTQQNLREARQKVVGSGQICNRRPDAALLEMPEAFEAKWQQHIRAVEFQQSESARRHRRSLVATAAAPLFDTPRPHSAVPNKDATMHATANARHHALVDQRAGQNPRMPTTTQPRGPTLKKADSVLKDTVPFPEYQDPIDSTFDATITEQQNLEHSNRDRSPHGGNRRRSLAGVVDKTGTKRQVTFRVPQVQKVASSAELGDPQSPVTPDDWSGTTVDDEVVTPARSVDAGPGSGPAIAGSNPVPASLTVESRAK